jgi:hypothetical protein
MDYNRQDSVISGCLRPSAEANPKFYGQLSGVWHHQALRPDFVASAWNQLAEAIFLNAAPKLFWRPLICAMMHSQADIQPAFPTRTSPHLWANLGRGFF